MSRSRRESADGAQRPGLCESADTSNPPNLPMLGNQGAMLSPNGETSVASWWQRIRSFGLVENLFFIAAAVFSLMLAAVMLHKGFSRIGDILFLVVFYAVLAYLALPRIHRILSALYVPDYFIGRTRTGDGLLGDPVNLAFQGSEAQIIQAMEKAGWTMADPINVNSAIKMITSFLTRRSYLSAPVSALFLFGKQQDLTFQQEVDGSPSKRHHVRFWRCPTGWMLPGGWKVDWLAAGTYDRSVGLSLFTLQVTHKISAHIDEERDYIVKSISDNVSDVNIEVIENYSTGYHSRNGGGDAIRTDGALPIVDVHEIGATDIAPREEPHNVLDDVGRRPISVLLAYLLVLVSTAIVAVRTLMREYGETILGGSSNLDVSRGETIAAVGIAFVTVNILSLLLCQLVFKGYNWARTLLLIIISLLLFTRLAHAIVRVPGTFDIILLAIDVLSVYALTTLSARGWTQQQRVGRKHRRSQAKLMRAMVNKSHKAR